MKNCKHEFASGICKYCRVPLASIRSTEAWAKKDKAARREHGKRIAAGMKARRREIETKAALGQEIYVFALLEAIDEYIEACEGHTDPLSDAQQKRVEKSFRRLKESRSLVVKP